VADAKRKLIVKSIVAILVMLVVLFTAGVVVGYLEGAGRLTGNGPAIWILGAFAVAAMGISLWIGLQWMRSIDEAAREAHKWAWYWGGNTGMAVGGVLVILAALPQAKMVQIPAWYAGRNDPAAYAATGAFGMLLLMLIGYLIAWAWWWWSHR
jgi:hypothetical protein